jgi:hypothetical protein
MSELLPPGRHLTDAEHEELADRMHAHMVQIQAGQIPTDAPFPFVKPEGEKALIEGKPWWFGPEYGTGGQVDP